jgi:hypothetical protein
MNRDRTRTSEVLMGRLMSKRETARRLRRADCAFDLVFQ